MTAAEQVLQQAIAAHRRGAIADAKRLYQRALELGPGSEMACGNLAVIAAQEGDLAESERLFRLAVKIKASAPGYNNLGLVLQQQGRPGEAVAAYRQAISLDSNYAQAGYGLGNALRQQGKLDEAVTVYQEVLRSAPDHVQTRINLGVVLQQQGKLEDAVAAYRQLIALNPDCVEAHYNLGLVLQEAGNLDGAVEAYQQVIRRRPSSPEAFNNLGVVLQQQGKLDAALVAFERAIACGPTHLDAHFNRGVILQQQGRLEEAAAAYRLVIERQPDHADALNNLAPILSEQGDPSAANAAQQQVIRLRPDYAEGHNNRGAILLDQGRPEEALDALRVALRLKFDYPEAHYNLGNALRELGGLEEAIGAYRQAVALRPGYAEAVGQLVYHQRRACDWTNHEADEAKLLDLLREGPARVPPFVLVATRAGAADQLRCARKWAERFGAPDGFVHERAPEQRRLRVGYLSADFHAHATAYLIAELIERHDRSRFEIHGFSYGPDDQSGMRSRLVDAFEHFIDIRSLAHRQAAERIFQEGIDILVDLKGYTHYSRPGIPAFRPAPVQVNYLGFPGTMGAGFIDYMIADRFLVPPDRQSFFAEKLAYLPGCYQPNDTRREIGAIPSREQCGLPNDAFVFCFFNNTFKITPDFFAIWMRLLQAVPGSVLWLLESNAAARRNLCAAAAARGIDPARLVFAPFVPQPAHLARHRQADLFLDTLPCNAHTTASDALWAGLPVLTCVGETFAGRVAGSLVTAAGLPELATTSLLDYEGLALALARNPQRLGNLRDKLRRDGAAVPLFDMAQRTRDLEALFTRMAEIRRAGGKPISLDVA